MRVLIVTQYFWPENFRINDLAVGLRDRGHAVTIYTGKPNYPMGRFFEGYGLFRRSTDNYHGIRIIRVPLIARGSGSAFRLAVNYLSFVLFASLLAPFRCRGRFDAILVYEPSPITVGLPALVIKALKRAPLLFWVQDLWPESLSATGAVRSKWMLKRVESLVRFIYHNCDRILVQSRAFLTPIALLGVRPDRILYFPNTAESLYRPVAAEDAVAEKQLLPDGFVVMFAGNIGAAQDFETIMAAAEKLRSFPDVHWVIIGDGRMLPWVECEITQRGLDGTMHLLGRYPVETMPRFFAHAGALLVTLKRDPIFALTIPAKVQSYLACARPIIAALEGEGARVIAEAGSGFAVPAENPQALADAVLTLANTQPEDLREMGQRGRKYFEENFERERLLDQLEGWMHAR